jgi:uncharacterized membrane protein
MTGDGRDGDMEGSVEARLQYLEERVRTLEGLLGVGAAPPAPAAPALPQPVRREPFPKAAPARAATPPPRRDPVDLEELLGGRVLGWVGGVAVVLAAVLFLVMAVHNGWIDEASRVVLAFVGSTVLILAGVWLYERKGQTQAARAAVAAGFAALYASDTTATTVYHLVSDGAGLAVAGLTGAAAMAVAVRWDSREVAGIGIVGALLAPVLVGAGTSTASLVFMTLALVGSIGVLIWRRWSWLAVVTYVVSAPQAASWIESERDHRLGLALGVTAAFWALYVVAALGYELRVPTTKLRLSSASLLFTNAALTAAGGWAMLDAAGNHQGATAWVLAVAAAHAALGIGGLRGRISSEVGALLAGVGAALAAVGLALALEGPALVAGWAAEAVLLAWVAKRTGDKRGYVGSIVFLGLAAGHSLIFEAPPRALAYGLDSVPSAVVALLLVVVGTLLVRSLLSDAVRENENGALGLVAAGFAVYLGSVLVVELAGAHPGSVDQNAQLSLSAFWAALGFGSLVAGLVREVRPLRLAGLALLGLAVGKVFIVDLAALESIWRVASFLALGLLLLAGAFAYQRMRKEGTA